jgi:hypothetical protein
MHEEFTIKEFNELRKHNKTFAQAWDDYVSFELWLALLPVELRQDIETECKKMINNGKEKR